MRIFVADQEGGTDLAPFMLTWLYATGWRVCRA